MAVTDGESITVHSFCNTPSEMLIVVLFHSSVDPDKPGQLLLNACELNQEERAIRLLNKGKCISDSRPVTDIIALLWHNVIRRSSYNYSSWSSYPNSGHFGDFQLSAVASSDA